MLTFNLAGDVGLMTNCPHALHAWRCVAPAQRMVSQAFECDANRQGRAWMAVLPQLPQPGGRRLQEALILAVRQGIRGQTCRDNQLSPSSRLPACTEVRCRPCNRSAA